MLDRCTGSGVGAVVTSRLPCPRGPLSDALLARLADGRPLASVELSGLLDAVDPLVDDDLHLALWCAYNLHYLSLIHI